MPPIDTNSPVAQNSPAALLRALQEALQAEKKTRRIFLFERGRAVIAPVSAAAHIAPADALEHFAAVSVRWAQICTDYGGDMKHPAVMAFRRDELIPAKNAKNGVSA